MNTILWSLFSRELCIITRNKTLWCSPILFFLMTTFLFSFALNHFTADLAQFMPGIIWVNILLYIAFSVQPLFKDDYTQGAYIELLLSPYPFEALLFFKMLAHWVAFGLPMVVIVPILGLLYGLQWAGIGKYIASLLLATPALCFMGSIGAALTLGLKTNNILLALLLLPLYVPILILGILCFYFTQSGLPISSFLALLLVILIVSALFAPFIVAFLIRVNQ